ADAVLGNDFFKYNGFIKDDLVHMKESSEAEAVIHERIATAYDHADPEEVQRLRKELEAAYRARLIWRERITDWRKRQGDAAPSEQWFQEQSHWHRGAMPELMALAEARKTAADAWGCVAEAVQPGADPIALAALKEQAFTADAEREIADLRYTWAHQRDLILQDKKLQSEDVTRRLAQLQKLQEDRLALRREEIEHDRKIRQADGAIRAADEEFRKAYESAQREAAQRAREKAAKR
ncbi:MAG: hypothetical protein JWN40_5232, partial [Phycisphaerales bacterium]|nr:hypothetical protein [Phycisphaerales bacterium]